MSYCCCLDVGKPLLRLAAVCRVVAVGTLVMPRERGRPLTPTTMPFTYSLLLTMLLLMFYSSRALSNRAAIQNKSERLFNIYNYLNF